MNSIEFEYDIFTFEVLYTYERGMKGDGYLQPDDPDKFDIDSILLKGYVDENGVKIELPDGADMKYIINNDIMLACESAIDKQILQKS